MQAIKHPLIRKAFMLVLLVSLCISCTKEVKLFTEVEFELITSNTNQGYLNGLLTTTIEVIPEEVLEELSYGFTYSINNGEGYFVDPNGVLLAENSKITLNSLATSLSYIGTSVGDHEVKIIASDNYGEEKEETLLYTIDEVSVIWTATSTATQVELGKTVVIVVNFEIDDTESGISFVRNYKLEASQGELKDNDTENSIVLNEDVQIAPGTYTVDFTPSTLGIVPINFVLIDSNNQERNVILSFEVVEDIIDTMAPELTILGDNPIDVFLGVTYQDEGATALDDIDGDISSEIAVDVSQVDTTVEDAYEVTYTVSDDDGNIATASRMVNVVRDPSGNQPPMANDITRAGTNTETTIFSVLDATSDLESDPIAIISLGSVIPMEAGTVSFTGGDISFSPSAGYVGTAEFTYTINDGKIWNEATGTVVITITQGNRKPVAVAELLPDYNPTTLTRNFSGAGSSDPDGDILSYSWSFGDPSNPISGSIGENASWPFTAAGTYQVTLTVFDGNGEQNSDTIEVVVEEPSNIIFSDGKIAQSIYVQEFGGIQTQGTVTVVNNPSSFIIRASGLQATTYFVIDGVEYSVSSSTLGLGNNSQETLTTPVFPLGTYTYELRVFNGASGVGGDASGGVGENN
ncbi:immunoglobulin-like domain-containing protein [Cellulophaga sp. HaHa_2_1]|uniref:immunoglobulin-like domain-containing protein n=1 Tax=Cellulophaga sp. HaHa_2_1 TaxID=2749994 RepID=UPI001C4E9D55|nr:immunoglobulin-like domain-containing protein [Cellulophaga sp. HaHa_2_1]QXP53517.1 DUF5011 domain-containing protein [Cellulophaga sp. HaHa_2_1]